MESIQKVKISVSTDDNNYNDVVSSFTLTDPTGKVFYFRIDYSKNILFIFILTRFLTHLHPTKEPQ